jgi:site-specific recombinase XerC
MGVVDEAASVGSFGAPQAAALLTSLRNRGLSAQSAQAYYAAFKRMVRLAGGNVEGWPAAPLPPRKSRDAIKEDDLERLIEWFGAKGYADTADLAVLLRGTGLRVDVEGLSREAIRYEVPRDGAEDCGDIPGAEGAGAGAYGLLYITGKGGHERVIPVVDGAAMAVLGEAARLAAIRAVSYRTHLKRWSKGVSELGIKSRLPTPHSVRHRYATDALKRSGGNLALVQELLGHADPATTVRYLGLDMRDKVKALGG